MIWITNPNFKQYHEAGKSLKTAIDFSIKFDSLQIPCQSSKISTLLVPCLAPVFVRQAETFFEMSRLQLEIWIPISYLLQCIPGLMQITLWGCGFTERRGTLPKAWCFGNSRCASLTSVRPCVRPHGVQVLLFSVWRLQRAGRKQRSLLPHWCQPPSAVICSKRSNKQQRPCGKSTTTR